MAREKWTWRIAAYGYGNKQEAGQAYKREELIEATPTEQELSEANVAIIVLTSESGLREQVVTVRYIAGTFGDAGDFNNGSALDYIAADVAALADSYDMELA